MTELLTPKEVSKMLGVTESTLNVWRCTKRYPLNYVKIGFHVRYRKDDVMNFIESLQRKEGRSADADNF
ncbi:MAG: helix-turn-helix domain-containing protein [Rickettsiales bacterium]|nr:helix-turn-helix domain-containing protein [Pseudomonadota bacterium]MDA0966553.1 helix-turn-helix domain-containing protein [Pseudomonadota bacterium]MDG4543582.1 helix-turn-helix domain-containing protein [Rickettsiales bacterium]MDG4545729.1 helix-turn-helix domain-containing protein [Rickettsiales bacterium]MDG4547498.1 helix-turn-helix domain-containing protein [Rickettsiales bacterium]